MRESCALDLCREAADRDRDAALALKRWSALIDAREQGRSDAERRFRRRAFDRARDRALIGLAMGEPSARVEARSDEQAEATGPTPAEKRRARWRGRRRRDTGARPRGQAATS
jgi:hypothetical protein